MTANQAIEQSIESKEIVYAPYTQELAEELGLEAFDSVENGKVVEFFGYCDEEDGYLKTEEWRVHLDRPE